MTHWSLTPWQIFSVTPLGCMVSVELDFLHELIGVLLLPLAGALLVLLVALLAARCALPAEERGVLTVAARPETCTLQLWLLLLLYPSLAKTALVPFDCVRYGGGPGGNSRLPSAIRLQWSLAAAVTLQGARSAPEARSGSLAFRG